MQKLKTIVEMIGRKRSLSEALPALNGVEIKPGMKVVLQDATTMLKNHYYEPHPQFYKKLVPQIAGTVQTVEEIKPIGAIESNSVKLVGFDTWIEVDDILKIKGR